MCIKILNCADRRACRDTVLSIQRADENIFSNICCKIAKNFKILHLIVSAAKNNVKNVFKAVLSSARRNTRETGTTKKSQQKILKIFIFLSNKRVGILKAARATRISSGIVCIQKSIQKTMQKTRIQYLAQEKRANYIIVKETVEN